MRKNWWKILAVFLMLYVLIWGFLMPMKPGVLSVYPQNINSGDEVELDIQTYNARLSSHDQSDIRIWLRNDTSYLVQADLVDVMSDDRLKAKFKIPEFLPTSDSIAFFSLIMDAPRIGSFVIPSSVFIKQLNIDMQQGIASWSKVKLENLNSYEGLGIPFRNILQETLRNTYFHVSLWFSMFILYLVSVIYSIQYLRKKTPFKDYVASSLVEVGTLYGVLGLITGAIWAKNTWGTYWTTDVKLNMAAISMLIYAAYLVLRTSINDEDRKSIIASTYNIFAFFIIIPLIFVIPRLTDSLHPGNGGNPGFGGDDMDNTIRLVFYPAIIGFTLLAVWMAELRIRLKVIREKIYENEASNN